MITFAIASRRMQFSAGPQSTVFYACARHRSRLDGPRYGMDLFYVLPQWPVVDVSEDDEIACDSCRAEDGP